MGEIMSSHTIPIKAWLLINENDAECTEVIIQVDLDIDRDGATIEGYTLDGKPISFDKIREENPRIDKHLESRISKYLANMEDL